MKGPSLRLKRDFSRRWECPACHARLRTSGAVTSMICACSKNTGTTQLMQLMHDGQPLLPWSDQINVAAIAASASEHLEKLADEDSTA